MRQEDVTEVLQWMQLAMGTDANIVFSEEAPVDLNAMVSRLQQLKTESDLNRNEADRYKRELEDTKRESIDLKLKLETAVSQLMKEAESRGETERCKAEWETGLKTFHERLSAETAKVSQLTEELSAMGMETGQYKKELGDAKRESDELKSELEKMISQHTKDLEICRCETERCKTEWETALRLFNENLSSETAKVSHLTKELETARKEAGKYKMERDESTAAFKDVITLKNAKIRQIEVEIEKIRAESSVYQISTDTKTHISSLTTALQLKMDELKVMVNKSGGNEDNKSSIIPTNERVIRAKFTDISKLTTVSVRSQSTNFSGINWNICVYKKDDYLAIYLDAKKNNADKWSCSTFFQLQLISQKNEKVVLRHGIDHEALVFSEKACRWGWEKFISIKDLNDKEKVYVKEDSIIVAAVIRAFPAQ